MKLTVLRLCGASILLALSGQTFAQESLSLALQDQLVSAGELVLVDVNYATDTDSPGIGVRVHFNSEVLDFVSIDDALSAHQVGAQSPVADNKDADNDPLTDQYVLVAWADVMGGRWMNADDQATLFKLTFQAKAAALESGITSLNLSTSAASAGATLTSALLQLAE